MTPNPGTIMPSPTSFVLISPKALVFFERPDENTCDFCGAAVGVGDWPSCGGDSTKHQPIHPRPLFVPFDYEGRSIDSIQAADRVERDSARAAADGIGQPIRFRAFHQDQSNYDRNTFGPSPQVPTPRRANLKPSWGEKAKNRDVHPAVRRIKGE